MENASGLNAGANNDNSDCQSPDSSPSTDKQQTDNQQAYKLAREQALLAWLNADSPIFADALHMVSGDASFRRYFRCEFEGCNYIAVDAPPDRENNPAFLNVANKYHAAGVRVPTIVAQNLDLGFWVLEDFGNVLLSDCFKQNNIQGLYQNALAQLQPIQSVTTGIPGFDDTLLDSEFHLFNHWLLQVHLDLALSQQEYQLLSDAQDSIRSVFKAQPQAGVHRDYHSRNLMVLDGNNIGVIDFQDAVTGPITYDAVSLLRDCYVTWPDEFVTQLLKEWWQTQTWDEDFDTLKYWFDFVGMQRHIKASGIFCRLCHRDGKQNYLLDIPRTLEYIVKVAASYDETREFGLLVQNKILPAIIQKNRQVS